MQARQRLYLTLSALAVVASVVTVGIFVSKFGLSNSSAGLSGNPSDWGVFGDYVGGTLGTIFGALAFVGVLVTLRIQQTQIDEIRNQFKLEELQRLIASLSSKVDEILDSDIPDTYAAALRENNVEFTVRNLVHGGGHLALSKKQPTNYLEVNARKSRLAMIRAVVSRQMDQFQIEINQLAALLERYHDDGGSRAVSQFYYQRYAPVVCWVDALGLLPACPHGKKYFEPEKHRAWLEHDD
jgi:hypothetical protein